MQKLFIISSEKIYEDNNNFYCDNIELKSTPEGLNKKFEVNLLARKSNIKRSHRINIKNIKIFGTLFSFLCSLIFSIRKEKEAKYLLISVSPYTFIACIFIKKTNRNIIRYFFIQTMLSQQLRFRFPIYNLLQDWINDLASLIDLTAFSSLAL